MNTSRIDPVTTENSDIFRFVVVVTKLLNLKVQGNFTHKSHLNCLASINFIIKNNLWSYITDNCCLPYLLHCKKCGFIYKTFNEPNQTNVI